MRSVTFTEFRQNASALFSAVEEGEIIHIIRHGKEIAEISPLPRGDKMQPAWKKKRIKLSIPGKALSEAIIDERKNA